MLNIEREIAQLTNPFTDQISKENLGSGDRSPSQIARDWANLGHPAFTACYLQAAEDLSNEDKTTILADAYENSSRDYTITAQILTELKGTDEGYLERSRANLDKASALRRSLQK